MDYGKAYFNLIRKSKLISPIDRIRLRNPNDIRLLLGVVYTEKHHIIPRYDGGTDEEENIAILLPEEHYYAHLIRQKQLKKRGDFIAARIVKNGFESKSSLQEIRGSFSKKLSNFLFRIKHFRKLSSQQTEDGVKRISLARQGTFPGVDEDGNMYSVRTDDPRVLDGKIQHHSKGKTRVKNLETGVISYIKTSDFDETKYIKVARSQKGSKNGNFKILDPEKLELQFSQLESISVEGHILRNDLRDLTTKVFPEYRLLREFTVISKLGYSSIQDMLSDYNEKNGTNLKYNPYFRSSRQRAKCSKESSRYRQMTNGQENIRVLEEDKQSQLDKGYRKGRVKC